MIKALNAVNSVDRLATLFEELDGLVSWASKSSFLLLKVFVRLKRVACTVIKR